MAEELIGYRRGEPRELLAIRLRQMRETWGLSQADVARHAQTTQRIISQIEAGTYNPSVQLLERLGRVFQCRVEIYFRNSR